MTIDEELVRKNKSECMTQQFLAQSRRVFCSNSELLQKSATKSEAKRASQASRFIYGQVLGTYLCIPLSELELTMHQSFVACSDIARQLPHLAALAWGAAVTCVSAVEANIQILEGHNPLLQAYMVKQTEKLAPLSGNRLATIESAAGRPEAPFFTASESTQCRERPYRFCRDFAQSEFRLTSLRFMLPKVRGLAPKSLTIRRNSVIANYTFR